MGNNFISILSTDQLREADQFTIANEPISSTKLMERAAFACFQWIEKHVAMDQNFRVFCGTGNNGGDGLVVAKLLIKNNCLVSVYIACKHTSCLMSAHTTHFQALLLGPHS